VTAGSSPDRGLYEWVETGPLVSDPKHKLSEASIARVDGQWVIAARVSGLNRAAWMRTPDPFVEVPAPVYPSSPACNSPLTAFVCADGVLRMFTGDPTVSPQRNSRDPLYCWDIDPAHDFASSNRRTIFDSVGRGLPILPAAVPKVDFCKLLPHHGHSQLVMHSVCTRAYNFPYAGRTDIPAIAARDKAHLAIYHARINYREEMPPRWRFA